VVRSALTHEQSGVSCSASPKPARTPPAVKTRGVRAEGGWIVNGQKVWTSGAQYCQRGLGHGSHRSAAPKHAASP